MMGWFDFLLPTVCFALSAFVVWLAMGYAHRRALYDLPGRRRSHHVPTPRGGGIGIVVAILIGLAIGAVAGGLRSMPYEWAMLAVAVVAAAGWIDDHRGLSARIRLAMQTVAVLALYSPLFYFLAFGISSLLTGDYVRLMGSGPDIGGASPTKAFVLTLIILALIILAFLMANLWFVNLHNFMDGIDGLLACQAIFVFAVFAWLVPGMGREISLLCAAAVAGFLPFNFPRARIFMGDVGSGALGLLIAGAVTFQALQALMFGGSPYAGLIACSAFVADATCTLLSRLLAGRRWYNAHREHLYQWLVRSGFSHARTTGLYMAWNLAIVVPVLWLMRVEHGRSIAWPGAVYALAIAAWFAGKRWCLHRAKKCQSIRT